MKLGRTTQIRTGDLYHVKVRQVNLLKQSETINQLKTTG